MADKESRSSAKATIIAAVIGLIGVFGGIWYQSTKTENIQVDLHLKQEEVDQLTQDNQELQTDKTELEQKVAELESKLGIVQGEQDSAKESSEQLQQQYDELKKQYSEISAQNDAIKVQLDNMGIDIPQTKDSPEENSTLDSDSVWLSNLDYLDESGDWIIGEVSKSNNGIEYSHSIENDTQYYSGGTVGGRFYRVYHLYGQYTKITGFFYQVYSSRTADGSTYLRFYNDDDNTLLNKETYVVSRGSNPMPFEINVEGVDKLKIELDGYPADTSLGEVALWK